MRLTIQRHDRLLLLLLFCLHSSPAIYCERNKNSYCCCCMYTFFFMKIKVSSFCTFIYFHAKARKLPLELNNLRRCFWIWIQLSCRRCDYLWKLCKVINVIALAFEMLFESLIETLE
jgi:hypothetical protein